MLRCLKVAARTVAAGTALVASEGSNCGRWRACLNSDDLFNITVLNGKQKTWKIIHIHTMYKHNNGNEYVHSNSIHVAKYTQKYNLARIIVYVNYMYMYR